MSSAARITKVPLGTLTSTPSMVTLTISTASAVPVSPESTVWVIWTPTPLLGASRRKNVRHADATHPSASARRRNAPSHTHLFRGHQRRGVRIERTTTRQMLKVFVAEELDRRHDRRRGAVAQGAERLPEDVVGNVQQLLDVLFGPSACLQPLVDLRQPVGALTAGRALAAGLVCVELGPAPDRAYHAGGFVEDLQCLGAEHGADPRHPFVIQRHIEVFVGQQRGGRATGGPELQRVPGPDAARVVE